MDLTNVSVLRCSLCHRPVMLYGNRDPRSGWVGWCRICLFHWRYPSARQLIVYKLLQKIPMPSNVLSIIFSFFVGEVLKRIKYDAWHASWFRLLFVEHSYWKQCLLFHASQYYWDLDPVIIPVPFVLRNSFCDNPLWFWNGFRHQCCFFIHWNFRPLRILTELLGKPPSDTYVEYDVKDTLLWLEDFCLINYVFLNHVCFFF